MKFAVSLIIIFAAGPVLANPIHCTNGTLTRRIEVVYPDPGQAVPCEVIYDKAGEGSIETLWQANNEAGYCEARAADLAARLGDVGWTCTAEQSSAAQRDRSTGNRSGATSW